MPLKGRSEKHKAANRLAYTRPKLHALYEKTTGYEFTLGAADLITASLIRITQFVMRNSPEESSIEFIVHTLQKDKRLVDFMNVSKRYQGANVIPIPYEYSKMITDLFLSSKDNLLQKQRKVKLDDDAINALGKLFYEPYLNFMIPLTLKLYVKPDTDEFINAEDLIYFSPNRLFLSTHNRNY